MAELRRNLLINGVKYDLAVSQYGEGAPIATTPGKPGVIYLDTREEEQRCYICVGGTVDNWVWIMLPKHVEVDGKFDKTGGNITGGVNVSNAYSNGYGTFYKNNSASADYGTAISDIAKDGSRLDLFLRASENKAYLYYGGELLQVITTQDVTPIQTAVNEAKAAAESAEEKATEAKNAADNAAPASHNHAASDITSGTMPVARGGTGVTSNPSMLVNLGSTSAASVFASSPRPGVTGTLPVSKGGTGATTEAAALTALGAAPAYSYGTEDLTAGESALATGKLHFVYE